MSHDDLHKARKKQNDEFYTQYQDIEKELSNYIEHFKDKVVFCNCDDPKYSNFWRFFHCNFGWLGLKKIISTHYNYDGSPSYALTYEGGYDLDVEVGTEIPLKENGDFRSDECIEFLKEADIVVTNPPFSLFREYVAQLVEYDKKFLIIGNINALSYKEIFLLIKTNKAWLGTGMGRWISGFIVPETYELYGSEARINENGERIVSTNNCLWLTNLDHEKRHEPFFKKEVAYSHYIGNESLFPKYDNYDAINVDKTNDIPCDYYGIMGVPITFMNKYNPDDFEILDINPHFFSIVEQGLPKPKQLTLKNAGKKDPYARILIKRIKGEK